MGESNIARRRNAADSRDRLLKAASELFAERGYEHTTTREVGQRAGVDPSMIARYFGGKPLLYLASLRGDPTSVDDDTIDLASANAVEQLLERVGNGHPTPTLYAAVRPHEDVELQQAAMDVLSRRMIGPAARRARSAGHDNAELRAQVVTAALAGIVLSRTSESFSALADASSAEVAALVSDLTNSLLGESGSNWFNSRQAGEDLIEEIEQRPPGSSV